MYRQYENPYELEERLKTLKAELEEEINNGTPLFELIDLSIEIEELKDRINFAWQDEYEDDY